MTKLSTSPRLAEIFERFAVPEARRVRLYTAGHSRDTTGQSMNKREHLENKLRYSLDFVREIDYIRALSETIYGIRQHIYGVHSCLRDIMNLRKVSAKVRNGGLRSRYYTHSILTRLRKTKINSFVMRIQGFLKENKYRNFLWQI